MTDRPWYASPVFYVLLALATAALFYLHEPILGAFEGWADRYFSPQGISDTMSSVMSDSNAGLLELLFKAIFAIILAIILIVFALIVWALLLGWKYYVLVPVVGAGMAFLLRVIVEPFFAGFKTEPARPRPARPKSRSSVEEPQSYGPPQTVGDSSALRRGKIEAWLRSGDK